MKTKFKAIASTVLGGVMSVAMFAGCASEQDEVGNKQLSFWCSWGTDVVIPLQQIIDGFNESQDKYTVKVEQAGGIDDIRNTLASTKQKNLPSMFCGGATTPAIYANAEYLAPLQDFIDEDSEDWTSSLFPAVKSSYSDRDGNLLGHPIGVSCAGYAVNTDLLAKVKKSDGTSYTLEDLTSFKAISEVATKAVQQGLCKYGLSFQSGVDLLDMLTMQGVDYVDNDNGWTANATKTLLYEKDTATYTAVKEVADIVDDLYKNNVGLAMGGAGPDKNAFIGNNMLFWKTTNSTAHISLHGNANVNFNWAFITSVGVNEDAEYKGQALSEGTGIYIANTGDENEMEGAYQFIKYLAKPENKLYWATTIGYVAYSNDILDEYNVWAEENYPSAKNIIASLQNSEASLRLPYVNVDLLSPSWTLLTSVANNKTRGEVDTYIKEAALTINRNLKLANL